MSWEEEADRLAGESIARGDRTGWFEQLYAGGRAGTTDLPWDRSDANVLLAGFLADRPSGGRALVVGCGLGADAEAIAAAGWTTTAFDVSPTAIDVVRTRRPTSPVDYEVADLLALPPAWNGAFDLVVEIYTVQALPDDIRPDAIAAVARCVAPGGTLLVVASARDPDEPPHQPPPWPLTADEIASFAAGGDLTLATLEDVPAPVRRWRATFERPT